MKKCSSCGEIKTLEDFHNRKSSKDGKQSACKICANGSVRSWQKDNPDKFESIWRKHSYGPEALLKRKARKYSLTVETLKELIDDADGRCKICRREPRESLVIDHCHNSGNVRGLLCEKCNQGLGLFADNIEYLLNAIEYLQGPLAQ